MNTQANAASPWAEASLAAALFAVDPRIGGVALRAGAGPVRDAWLAYLRFLLDPSSIMRKVPLGIGDDRLIGGLDLTATLRAGKPIASQGVMAEADGGVLVFPMAERLSAATAARMTSVMDCGEVSVERDGLNLSKPARFGVILLDEAQTADEHPPQALLDRLGFCLDLNEIGYRECGERFYDAAQVAKARLRLASIRIENSTIETLVTVGTKLGVGSFRAPLFALKAASAHCALRSGDVVEEADIVAAVRLVLAPRASIIPTAGAPEDQQEPSDPQESEPGQEPQENEGGGENSPENDAPPPNLEDVILAAAIAAIPQGLLDQIKAGSPTRMKSQRGGKAEDKSASQRRGRPLAARAGSLRDGRLALVDTLRAAVPWQGLRRSTRPTSDQRRFIVRPEDFRIVRFKEQRETATIFVIDASGSSAMQRLAEVKGAIELLLADCYVRRDSVALIAFRGKEAEIVLPPTRSLARAKRTLAGLPGGGGTPIAKGIDTALDLADSLRRKGQSPLIVLMTDGRANITRDGGPGRTQAFEDALNACGRVSASGIAALAIDTAPMLRQASAEPPTFRLGQAMNARYIQLPNADAARVSEAVRAASMAS